MSDEDQRSQGEPVSGLASDYARWLAGQGVSFTVSRGGQPEGARPRQAGPPRRLAIRKAGRR